MYAMWGMTASLQVRKTLAKCGLDVMGTANELKRRLAEHVMAEAGSAAGGGSGGGGGVVEQALACGDDYLALLSLGAGGVALTAASPAADLRRAYLKLAVRISGGRVVVVCLCVCVCVCVCVFVCICTCVLRVCAYYVCEYMFVRVCFSVCA